MLITPMLIENEGGGTRAQDMFSRLLGDRIVMLFHQITDDAACVVIAQLLYLEAQAPDRDIRMYINCPGGDVQAGLAIYDTMRHLRCDVSTLCVGRAASMGAFLLAAGTRGKRASLPSSSILIHQTLGAIPMLQATDVGIHANQLCFVKEQVNRLLAHSVGRSVEEVARDTERDRYMTPRQALEYGIIDRVIEARGGLIE